jgi:uncharacterized protein YdhG (YjbR/CyaY superfamily)
MQAGGSASNQRQIYASCRRRLGTQENTPPSRQKGDFADTMNRAKLQSVDEYIALQPKLAAAKLAVVRSIIRKALPKTEEVISYNMPAYRLLNEVVLYFAGWKQHYSLYPAGPHLVDAFKKELAGCKVNKGTIRFSYSTPVPKKLIGDIARFRLAEVAGLKKDRRGA